MDCPVCKEPLIILEHKMIETDYCVSCGGMWLDSGELELLTKNRITPAEIFIPAKNLKNEKPVKCPRCLKKMNKQVALDKIVIDSCSKGHGYWFDKGELLEIVSTVHGETNNIVKDFLKDLLNPETKK